MLNSLSKIWNCERVNEEISSMTGEEEEYYSDSHVHAIQNSNPSTVTCSTGLSFLGSYLTL